MAFTGYNFLFGEPEAVRRPIQHCYGTNQMPSFYSMLPFEPNMNMSSCRRPVTRLAPNPGCCSRGFFKPDDHHHGTDPAAQPHAAGDIPLDVLFADVLKHLASTIKTDSQQKCTEQQRQGSCKEEGRPCSNNRESTRRQHKHLWKKMVTKQWCKTVNLPSGFTVRHLQDISVKDDQVLIKLVKTMCDESGPHDIVAVHNTQLPKGILKQSLNIMCLGENLQIIGLQRTPICDPENCCKTAKTCSGCQDGDATETPVTTPAPKDEVTQNTSDPRSEDQESQESDTNAADADFEILQMNDGHIPDQNEIKETSEDCPCEPKAECCKTHPDCDNPEQSECPCDRQSDKPARINAEELATEVETGAHTENQESSECDKDIEEPSEAPKEAVSTTELHVPQSNAPDLFQTVLNMAPFRPDEISLRLAGNKLSVDAVHQEENDGSTANMEIHRSIMIPHNINVDKMKSQMSEEGELIISAPYLLDQPEERIIHITM